MFSPCYAQKQDLHFFVKKLMEGKRHETQTIGIGFPGDQWPYYIGFKELATEPQLIRYCHHPNNIIRAYSFQALLDVNIGEARKIYKRQENSNRIVEVFHGCTYTGLKSLYELYGQLIYARFGKTLLCWEGPQTEDEKTYFWFMQKDR